MSDTIKIAEDFSQYPGGRFRVDGKFSGEEFREDFLKPALTKALSNNEVVIVDLDGTFGYASSFLDEAFGGLVRQGGVAYDALIAHLKLQATSPHIILYKRLAEQFMKEASHLKPMRNSA